MSIKPEFGGPLSDHNVFVLNNDEWLDRGPTGGIDWTSLDAIESLREKMIGSLRVSPDDQRMQLDLNAEKTLPYPVHHHFETYAQINPGAGAIKFNCTELTYGELDEQADQLAVRLQQNGLGPGEFCALYMEPSLALVRAILAVLKAGAAYLLVDPALQEEHILAILSVVHPRALIAEKNLSAKLGTTNEAVFLCGEDAVDFPYSWPNEALTQGSSLAFATANFTESGNLNIELTTHAALMTRLESMQQISPIGQGDSLLQNTDSARNISDLLWPLSRGARVVIGPKCCTIDPAHMQHLITEERITVMQLVPSAPDSFKVVLPALLWPSEQLAQYHSGDDASC